MNPLPKPAYWAISIFLIVFIFVLLIPSFIGLLLSLILVMAWADFSARRRRLAARTFNSAVRAVCRQEGAVGKVAVAFSRSGPLSGSCYEYARRLMSGENPVDAAAQAGIPLQLSTAIALEVPTGQIRAAAPRDIQERDELSHDVGSMPAYGQMFYLLMSACLICAVFTWIAIKIAPEMVAMMEEFEVTNTYEGEFDTSPAFMILAALALVVFVVIPILNRGQLFGIRFERMIPMLPAVARRRGETLYGLADAMDAGIPMGRALSIGHSITLGRPERRRWCSGRIPRPAADGRNPARPAVCRQPHWRFRGTCPGATGHPGATGCG